MGKKIILLVTLIFFVSCTLPDQKVFAPFLVVVNTLSETLSCLDSFDGQMKYSCGKTGQSPNQILQHNNDLFVVNSLSNSITVHDKDSLSIKNEFSTGNGTNPFKMVIFNNQIFVTAYCSHQVIVLSLDGVIQEKIDLQPNGQYYPYPTDIAQRNEYVFVACKESTNTTADTCNPNGSTVAVIKNQEVEKYIRLNCSNCTGLQVKNDKLYAFCSGTYKSGFNEDGKIFCIDLQNIANPTITEVANENSFCNCVFYDSYAYCTNLGNGSLLQYNTDTTPWTLVQRKKLDTKQLAFISCLELCESHNCLYGTEFNGNKLYRLTLPTLEIEKTYDCSTMDYGDCQNVIIIK